MRVSVACESLALIIFCVRSVSNSRSKWALRSWASLSCCLSFATSVAVCGEVEALPVEAPFEVEAFEPFAFDNPLEEDEDEDEDEADFGDILDVEEADEEESATCSAGGSAVAAKAAAAPGGNFDATAAALSLKPNGLDD